MARPSREQWRAALNQLREARAAGQLTSGKVRLAAGGLGVSERAVWYRLQAPESPEHGRAFCLSDADRTAFNDFHGNVAAVYRARTAAILGRDKATGAPIDRELLDGWKGAALVSLRTLQRAFEKEFTPAAAAWVRGGDRARRAKLTYLSRQATRRNEVWEGDHKQLPVLVLPPRRKACKPWVTTFIDDATRAIAGWAIADTPHEGTVLAALARAIMHDASGPVHGLPGRIRLDRGLEFAAKGVQSAAATFVVDLHVLPAFASNLKGKVERSNLTIDQMYSSTLPGYTKGRRDLSGRLSGPLDDRSTARAAYEEAAAAGADPGELPMSWKTFVEHFSDWVRWYNTEHLHSRLQGLTPTEAWNADPTAVRDVSPEDVRHLFRYGGTRIVNNDGIHFDNGVFTCPEGLLREIGGVTVEVRFMPHEDRYIDVYRHGSFLTRCYLVDKLTEQQRDDYYRSVRESDRKAAAVKRSVTARTRRRLAVMSRPDDPVEEARRIQPADMAATQRQNSAASAQRSRPREWSTSLLGIGPVSAVEEPSAELDTLLSEPGSPAFAIDEPPVVLDDILTDPPGGGYLAGEEDSW